VRLRLLLLLGAAAALAIAPLAAQGGSAKQRVKTTKRDIEAIGMDGPIVAYDLHADSGCNELFTWNVNTNGGKLVSGKGTCEADDSSTGAGVVDVAVAGNQIAWIVNEGGNTESDDYLYTSSLPKPKEKGLFFGMGVGDADQGVFDGPFVGGVVGDGSVLAATTGTMKGGVVRSAAVRLIVAGRLRTFLKRNRALNVVAAGAGRLAISQSDEAVMVYSAAGKLLGTYPGARDAALTAKLLVTLDGTSLRAFDLATDAKLPARTVPASARDLDAEGDIAVYGADCTRAPRCGRDVYALRLSTGKSVRLANVGELDGVEIEPAGVVYAFNTNKGGNIVVVPMAQIETKLR
jgi:hypothetical protein